MFRMNKLMRHNLKDKTKKMLMISKKKSKMFKRFSRPNKISNYRHKNKWINRKRYNMMMSNSINNSRRFNSYRTKLQTSKTLYKLLSKKQNK